MPEFTELEQELHHARRRIAELERLAARDRSLLNKTHSELHAIQSTYVWKLAKIYYRLRDQVLPPQSRVYRLLKSATKSALKHARSVWRRLRTRHAPGGRLGCNVCIDDAQYRRWIRRNEPDASALERQRNHQFSCQPRISVVMPVYRPPLPYLQEALESIRSQTYPNWEACIADASGTMEVGDLLANYAASDSRFHVRKLSENLGIAGNTNEAIRLASGEFVAFLDHDDTLAPFALHEIVRALNCSPDADLVYSDEDKLDARGRRTEPHFKPDWSPEYLQSLNYLCHLVVIRRELLTTLGGLRPGFEGAQDYDLVLRASESARRIEHVPKVLYHWRMHTDSTAATIAAKPAAVDAGRRALEEQCERRCIPATVERRNVPGIYRVRRLLEQRPAVSVIIPNRDQTELLRRCLLSLDRSRYEPSEILIVENGSTDAETKQLYREFASRPNRRVLEWNQPFNFAAVNNFAARQATGELLLFLNNDVEAISDDWLESMVAHLQPGVGAVGAKLRYPDGAIQHGGVILGMGGIAGHTHLGFPAEAPGYMRRLQFAHNCSAVTAACMLVPRAVFESVGRFDEGFVLAFNDVDLCLKIRQAGYRIVWTPDADLIHHESKSRGYEDSQAKQLRFQQEVELFRCKWTPELAAGDPYYSPHFRLDRCDWVLRG